MTARFFGAFASVALIVKLSWSTYQLQSPYLASLAVEPEQRKIESSSAPYVCANWQRKKFVLSRLIFLGDQPPASGD